MSEAKLLVTGANGFVGRALMAAGAARTLALRAAVRNPASFASLPSGAERIAVGDLAATTDWSAALEGCEVVVHLANLAHAAASEEALHRVNVDATLALAEQAVSHGLRRFVFVSSIKAIGETSGEKALRADAQPRPSDAYGRAKLAAEFALKELAAKRGLEVVIVRPPLVYGAGVRGNFLALLRAVARGIPLPFASIANRRSLVYAGNLAEALIACATHPGAAGRTYHVTDGEPVSTPALVRALGVALQRPARLLPFPPLLLEWIAGALRRRDTARRLTGSLELDDSAIRAELGWKPRLAFDEGLRDTARWYRSLRGAGG